MVIHIGPPKTGSTAIQQYLDKNRQFLRDNCVYFPLESNFISLFRYIIDDDEIDQLAILDFKKAMKKNYCSAVLSSEFFSAFSISEWEAFRRLCFDNIPSHQRVILKFVIYIRDPLKILLSSRQEMLKKGFTLKKLENAGLPLFYRNIYSRLLSVFSECQIITRRFSEDLSSFNVVKDFCDVVNIKYFEERKIKYNTALCLEAALILDKINSVSETEVPVNELILAKLKTIRGKDFVISEYEMDAITNELLEERKWIFENLGFSFSESIPAGYKIDDFF